MNIVYAISYKSISLINYLIKTNQNVLVISSNSNIIKYCNHKKISIEELHPKKISIIKNPFRYKAELLRVFETINLGQILWFTHNNHDSFGFALMRMYSKSGGIVNWIDLDPVPQQINYSDIFSEVTSDFIRFLRVILNVLCFRIYFGLRVSPAKIGVPRNTSLTLLHKNNNKNNFLDLTYLKDQLLDNVSDIKIMNQKKSCIIVWSFIPYIESKEFKQLIKILTSTFDTVEFKSHPETPITLDDSNIINLPSYIPANEFINTNKVVIGLSSVVLVEALILGCEVYSLLDIFPDIPNSSVTDQKYFLDSEINEYKTNKIVYIKTFEQLEKLCKKAA